ncbi:MAG: NUDIX hydrolase [Kaistella sp.]
MKSPRRQQLRVLKKLLKKARFTEFGQQYRFDEILLTKRNQEPKKGKLDLAGGFVDPRESAEQTCVRELFEEMKIQVDISKLKYLASLPNIYEYKSIVYNTLDLFYEYEVEEKFEADLEISEISDTVWLRIDEINPDEIAFDSQRIFLEKYKIQ